MIAVARVDLAQPLAAIALEAREQCALVRVEHAGTVLAEAVLERHELDDVVRLKAAVLRRVEPQLRAHALRLAIRRATCVASGTEDTSSIDVVVHAARRRANAAARCEEAVRSAPEVGEVVVVRRCPLAAAATASTPLVAVVRDRARPDAAWLAGVAAEFADPLVVAVTGDLGTSEARTAVQAAAIRPARGAGGRAVVGSEHDTAASDHVVLRRAWLLGRPDLETEAVGTLLQAALRDGFRLVVDPSRVALAEPPRGLATMIAEAFADGRAATGLGPLGAGHDLRIGTLKAVRWTAGHAGAVVGRSRRAARRRTASRRVIPGREPPAPRMVRELPPVSIVVPSFNRREGLRRLLLALAEQTAPPEAYEVVVVIDGSTDGSAAMTSALELPYRLRVLDRRNAGVAASRNAGTREATHAVVVHLDDDLSASRGFVAAHAAAHAAGHERDIVIGDVATVLHGRVDGWALRQRREWEDHYRRKAEPNHPWTFYDFSVGNASMRRDLLVRAGGFDDAMRRHDDQESSVRLVRAGARFRFAPEAFAWHHVEGDLAYSLRQIRAQGRYDVELARRHPHLQHVLPFQSMRVGSRLSRRAALAFAMPRAADGATAAGTRVVWTLEAAGARRAALAATSYVTAMAYTRGLRDAWPTAVMRERYLAELAPAPPARQLTIELTAEDRWWLPEDGSPAELVVSLEGQELARMSAQPAAHALTRAEIADRLATLAAEAPAAAAPTAVLLGLIGVP